MHGSMERAGGMLARIASALVIACWVEAAGADEATASVADEPVAEITMGELVPFAEGASGEVGLMSPGGSALRNIEDRCDLERSLAVAIAAEARRRGVAVAVVTHPEEATGRVLSIQIEGAVGQLGGAISGAKSLTLRGELRDGEALIASFVAREQRTALTAGTCKALDQCAAKLAKHIAKWLQRPKLRARLGSA